MPEHRRPGFDPALVAVSEGDEESQEARRRAESDPAAAEAIERFDALNSLLVASDAEEPASGLDAAAQEASRRFDFGHAASLREQVRRGDSVRDVLAREIARTAAPTARSRTPERSGPPRRRRRFMLAVVPIAAGVLGLPLAWGVIERLLSSDVPILESQTSTLPSGFPYRPKLRPANDPGTSDRLVLERDGQEPILNTIRWFLYVVWRPDEAAPEIVFPRPAADGSELPAEAVPDPSLVMMPQEMVVESGPLPVGPGTYLVIATRKQLADPAALIGSAQEHERPEDLRRALAERTGDGAISIQSIHTAGAAR